MGFGGQSLRRKRISEDFGALETASRDIMFRVFALPKINIIILGPLRPSPSLSALHGLRGQICHGRDVTGRLRDL